VIHTNNTIALAVLTLAVIALLSTSYVHAQSIQPLVQQQLPNTTTSAAPTRSRSNPAFTTTWAIIGTAAGRHSKTLPDRHRLNHRWQALSYHHHHQLLYLQIQKSVPVVVLFQMLLLSVTERQR
jgi:hypothetical protein